MALAVVGWTLPAVASAAVQPRLGGGRVLTGTFPGAPMYTGPDGNDDNIPTGAVGTDGTMWAIANIDRGGTTPTGVDPRATGDSTGSDIWISHNGGRTFTWLADPFNAGGATAGGYDTDIAAGTTALPDGSDELLAVAANDNGATPATGVESFMASDDGGSSWTHQSISDAGFADRPWLMADGACDFDLSYATDVTTHPIGGFNICTGHDSAPGSGAALEVASNGFDLEPGETSGRPAVDHSGGPLNGTVYIPELSCQEPNELAYLAFVEGDSPCPYPVDLQILRYEPRNDSFALITLGQTATEALPLLMGAVSVDAAGRLYVVWFDGRHAYLRSSGDGGDTWGPATQLDPPGGTAAFPAVSAGAPGEIGLAWLENPHPGAGDSTADLGAAGAPTGSPWHLMLARSFDAGETISSIPVPGTTHRGMICFGGLDCGETDSHAPYDSTEVKLDPSFGTITAFFQTDPGTFSARRAAFATWLPPSGSRGGTRRNPTRPDPKVARAGR